MYDPLSILDIAHHLINTHDDNKSEEDYILKKTWNTTLYQQLSSILEEYENLRAKKDSPYGS